MATGVASVISCAGGATVRTTPNKSAFNADRSLLATCWGNPYTGSLGLLVFDVFSGENVLATSLDGLGKALDVDSIAPFIEFWSIGFTAN